MSTSSQKKCSMCGQHSYDLQRLPFSGLACANCIDDQCNKELDEYTDQYNADNLALCCFQHQQPQHSNNSNFGVALNNLKQELASFKSEVTNYKQQIQQKIKLAKIDVTINKNYCINKINAQKALEFKYLDKLKEQTLGLVNQETIKRINVDLIKHENYLNEAKKNPRSTSNSGLDKCIDTIKKDIEEAHQATFSNKEFHYEIPDRTNFHINDLGYLKYHDIEVIDKTKETVDHISKSPYFKIQTSVDRVRSVKSFHILRESLMLVCQDERNKVQIIAFHLKSSMLKHEMTLATKKDLFLVCSNSDYLFTLDLLCLESNSLELALYDTNLNILKKVLVTDAAFKPVIVQMNTELLVVSDEKVLTMRKFDLDLTETGSLPLNDVHKFNGSYKDLNMYVGDCYIFFKQKFLFGTRLSVYNGEGDECLLNVDLFYFFDKFFMDMSARRVVFFCDGKFSIYDMRLKKVVSKMDFQESDKCICEFDYKCGGEVYILYPYQS